MIYKRDFCRHNEKCIPCFLFECKGIHYAEIENKDPKTFCALDENCEDKNCPKFHVYSKKPHFFVRKKCDQNNCDMYCNNLHLVMYNPSDVIKKENFCPLEKYCINKECNLVHVTNN